MEKLLFYPSSKHRQVELAKKYFYIMMFEYQHKIPMTFDEKGAFKLFNYKHFQQLFKDEDAPIQRVVDQIASGRIFSDFIFK
jgi:hypothetical protein